MDQNHSNLITFHPGDNAARARFCCWDQTIIFLVERPPFRIFKMINTPTEGRHHRPN